MQHEQVYIMLGAAYRKRLRRSMLRMILMSVAIAACWFAMMEAAMRWI